ncbi:TonB-dependent receptor [Flavobacterium gawalongense]|uniref:TonB-dependent receptor n=1 Tax=Flavobacterium gawalongense TaxID=2594432 RepID=A0A553BLX5_9FLAO|nr:TonB-dependent receptor [Flavobacterium gawalongense]TRX01224.1 TonB-dependent receptor [Flavobacterium gawalongense]TRX05251.1 TonB-dependent receptor [Flavobacterium gawalongense]TRX09154.1 TonB-dependent receptor [Flavobacterium gawalongense]TRX09211.1 TonB-dependent receptor [Flavobacterium gawalongense]TRX26668.1 TonB-dependent receptor [Flavobacterium gawalongense]
MKFKLIFFTLLITAISFSQNKGTVSGILTDKDSNNQSLPFANVLIKGTTIGTNTDIDGKYAIAIAPGNYTVQFSFVGYESVEIPVTVTANETVTLNQAIGSGSYKLEDVVIKNTASREKETALLLDQKKAVVIKQSIGAQEMARKGVSDVEEGLTKITGITKVGSRGLFVRGLEDRYNNLLINDLAAPTNNPFKKIIPLDLFSTDIVGVIEVYKTFNPNIYGDFAGGTFNIQTSKGSKSVTKLNIGIGYTVNNNLEKFLISKDANSTKGLFGLTGNDRKLPGLLGNRPSSYTLTADQSLRSFKSGFDVSKINSPLNSSIGLLHSEKFNLKDDKTFSYLLSINFDNNYSIRNGVERTFTNNPSGFTYRNDFDNTEYRYKTSLSSLVGLNYTTDRLKLSYNTLFIRTTENLVKDQFGVADSNSSNNNTLIRTNQLDESNYLNNQLLGEYALNEDKTQNVKAAVSYAITKYAQPDRKFFSGTRSGTEDILVSVAGNNFIKQYLDISGDSYFSGLAEYTLKFGKTEKNNIFTAGYNGNMSDMTSSYRFITPINNSAPNSFTTPLNTVDTQLNNYIASNAVSFRESSNATYQAKLKESANAGYANLLYKFGEKWEVNGGIRLESTMRETKYRTQGSFSDPFKTLKYDNLYVLPALNVKYGLNENSNLRFATGKTYTRPVVMESYPIEYINADGTSTKGNPFLENSNNYNVDLKYELFPTSKEVVVLGLFGKKIDQPIERTFISNAANSTITTYLNSDNAVLYGAEIEFILDFARINERLSDFSFGFNTSLMHTKVDVKPTTTDSDGNVTTSIETFRSRELQGASKWLINSDLKYQFNLRESWNNTVSLVYSVFGKRIYAVGTGGLDHIYELPVQQLDFIWSSKLSDHFDLKFSADNLLDPIRKSEQGNNGTSSIVEQSNITNSYKKGRGFSINLGYTF